MYKIAFSRMSLMGKIPYGDPIWPKFNASFENKELETLDIANEIYMGHAFTTWHKNSWRDSTNYLLGGHLALDFDTEDERSTLPYLAKDKFISKYAALIYTTPSYTPERPKARALFLLDASIQQAKNYVNAISALLWLFGSADRQCKDPCRFFYGSRNCDVEYLDNVLPLDLVKQLIQQYQATGAYTKKRAETNYKPTADQEEVAAALRAIPPWSIDYDEWLTVLMGIHNAFGDSGLALADQWAQGADGEIQRKWRSFNEDGNGSGRVTIRSVFKLAQRFGYGQQQMADAA